MTPVPLPDSFQIGLFDGQLYDRRTDKQRRVARQQAAPHQLAMFDSHTSYAQMLTRRPAGAPLNGRGQPVALALMMQDPRSQEEIERDQERAAQAQTYPLLG